MFKRNTMLRRLIGDQSGAALLYVTLTLPVMLMLCVYTINSSLIFLLRTELQYAADAAALAGVSQLDPAAVDDAAVQAEAVAYADLNMDPTKHVNSVLLAADVVTGNWDGANFTAGGAPKNAVRVVTKRAKSNINELKALFGYDRFFEVGAAAIAARFAAKSLCEVNGFVANGKMELGSTFESNGPVCMHGQTGVKMGSGNTFPGSEISMPDADPYPSGMLDAQGPNYVGEEEGLEPILIEREMVPTNAVNIDPLLADIKSGAKLPPGWTVAPAAENLPSTPAPNTLYILTKDVTLNKDMSLDGWGVYGQGSAKVVIDSDAIMTNFFVAGDGEINVGSKVKLGSTTFCSTGTGTVFIAGKGLISVGSDNHYHGVQIVGGSVEKGIEMGSTAQYSNFSVQSAGNIKIGSADGVPGCSRSEHVFTGGTSTLFSLVQ